MGDRRNDPSKKNDPPKRQVRQDEVSDLSKRAYRLLRESQTGSAIELFRLILEQEPGNNYALVGMGDALRKDKRYDEAIRHYEVCLEHHPGNHYALFGLAEFSQDPRRVFVELTARRGQRLTACGALQQLYAQ